MEIGPRIAALRGSRSQSDLANAARVDVSTISRIERGQIDPTLSTMQAIADALGIPLHRLLDPAVGSISYLAQPELVDHRARLEAVEGRLNRMAELLENMATARALAAESQGASMTESPPQSGGK